MYIKSKYLHEILVLTQILVLSCVGLTMVYKILVLSAKNPGTFMLLKINDLVKSWYFQGRNSRNPGTFMCRFFKYLTQNPGTFVIMFKYKILYVFIIILIIILFSKTNYNKNIYIGEVPGFLLILSGKALYRGEKIDLKVPGSCNPLWGKHMKVPGFFLKVPGFESGMT